MTARRVGVLGGGQLGQMMALAAAPLGVQVTCLERTAECPAALVCPVTVGDPASAEDVRAFAATVDVLTYETESLPAGPLRDLPTPLLPSLVSLAAAQDRWAEKRLFHDAGVPCAPTAAAATEAELRAALAELPKLVKTRTGGYDGRGQVLVRDPSQLDAALALLDEPGPGVVVEALVPFDREVSVIGARTAAGETAFWPVAQNEHVEGILRRSTPIAEPALQARAEALLGALLDRLDHVGVLTLELFDVGGELVANEIAPRVHNSGHWTIEGAATSQFEQHVRAVAGLPLGSVEVTVPSAMRNLIGAAADPGLLGVPGAHLHDYGKSARRARKLGHVTVTAPSSGQLAERVAAVDALVRDDG